jgi:hypothetical protein
MTDNNDPNSLWQAIESGVAAVWTSLVRTFIPLIVGLVVSWLVTLGVPTSDDLKSALTALLTAVFAAIYYLIARLLEAGGNAWASWLLLSGHKPVAYAKSKAVTTGAVVAAPAATVNTTVHPNAPPASDDKAL